MTGPAATDLIERLDRLLPQTQCGQCGYPGCRPYAEAMAVGEAGPERCPPGGDAGASALALLLGVAPLGYDRSRGEHKPPQVAVVVEADCIGCTKCIQACPVDAIIGANKLMHVVIDALCTGCELCVPACPVDCIHMESVTGERTGWAAWSPEEARSARARHAATQRRRQPTPGLAGEPPCDDAPAPSAGDAATAGDTAPERKRALIEAALARARQNRPAA